MAGPTFRGNMMAGRHDEIENDERLESLQKQVEKQARVIDLILETLNLEVHDISARPAGLELRKHDNR